ncbi:MAG TPA: MBL fold metallo-hydrolase [Methyloceanibacter sp.]|nr:MBL fold metallo-hydrolase [Methyloceanibacter sp.]
MGRPRVASLRRANIELTFLGTRGEIAARSRRHRRHSALLVQRRRARIMIDCGADWLKAVKRVGPTAIVLTHGHGDHAFGLAQGAPCPVYATAETWAIIARFPIEDLHVVESRLPFAIGGVTFEAFPVQHSLRAPAVGYRVSAGQSIFFYVPDLAAIGEQHEALRGIDLYIGDGATVVRSMVRVRDHALIGHAPITAQLGWCEAEGVARAIFTHCGSGIVNDDARRMAARIRALGEAHGVEASLAHDGLRLSL